MIPKPVWIVLAVLALAYVALCGWMYAAQLQLVYFPQFTRADAATTDFALEYDGVTLRGWVANPGHGRAVVYFGGNGESVQDNRTLFEHWLPGHSVYLGCLPRLRRQRRRTFAARPAGRCIGDLRPGAAGASGRAGGAGRA